ncbi:hypothetical protein [Nitrospirillum sp. BR 11163]|uniref:hypothetical protein n=1 Tax=Nitrospirillum sp. BR 11163 TaxID=3104323 RepID=UPI002AFE4C7C|nr:hypothetical protein [Nitrospirillum sp. BR 11163]MEA1676141.1 hypothetical protein [Nitrospirillum sp. BR 11163]
MTASVKRINIISATLIATLITCKSGMAGSANSVYVIQPQVELGQNLAGGSGIAFVYISSDTTSTPACSRYADRLAIDPSSDVGKAMLSVVLTAYSLNKKVNIAGTGSCNLWSDSETLQWIVIPPQ